jgi:hypothetical protein
VSAGVPLEVRVAVEELHARYAELMDVGDFAGVGSLFAEAAITTEDGIVIAQGADAIEELYGSFTRRYDDGTPRSQHVITNLIVEPDSRERHADHYVARSVFVVFQATDDLPLQPIITGRYRDVVVAHDATVALVERCMMPNLSGDLSAHLLRPVDGS